ncbi:hypothetical protein [Nocardiopsis synnemataformans]|uniref:hypothetical protein n=1 Tax=Nocardiopsis synnemataformans TaxID=61305 RepID=UPI003EBAB3F8
MLNIDHQPATAITALKVLVEDHDMTEWDTLDCLKLALPAGLRGGQRKKEGRRALHQSHSGDAFFAAELAEITTLSARAAAQRETLTLLEAAETA